MPQLEEIMARLNQLTEEVRELKSRQGGEKPAPQGESTFTEIIQLLQAYTDSLDLAGEKFICHCTLDAEAAWSTVQVTWLGALREDDSYSTARYCAALANEHRIKILKALAGQEQTTAQLSEFTGLEGGPLYHHLKELITARFVQQRERSCYKITREGLDALLTVGALNRRNTWGQTEIWQGGEGDED